MTDYGNDLGNTPYPVMRTKEELTYYKNYYWSCEFY